jgi:hypothetical protein
VALTCTVSTTKYKHSEMKHECLYVSYLATINPVIHLWSTQFDCRSERLVGLLWKLLHPRQENAGGVCDWSKPLCLFATSLCQTVRRPSCLRNACRMLGHYLDSKHSRALPSPCQSCIHNTLLTSLCSKTTSIFERFAEELINHKTIIKNFEVFGSGAS